MKGYWSGWIAAEEADRSLLEALGVQLGDYDADKQEFPQAVVPDDALDKLDHFWGRFNVGSRVDSVSLRATCIQEQIQRKDADLFLDALLGGLKLIATRGKVRSLLRFMHEITS